MSTIPARLLAAPASQPVWRSDSLLPTAIWNTLSLDMRVSRTHVKASGEAAGAPLPAAAYRIERSSVSGRWKTVIYVLSVDRAPVYSLTGALSPPAPFPISRIEDDEDGTPVRAYDPHGVRVAVPPSPVSADITSSLPRATGQQWLHAFVATTGRKSLRQAAFERQFGKATKVGPLHRYLKLQSDTSQEVLVDPKTVVSVESTVTKNGKRMGRRVFAYASAPDSAVVRWKVDSDTVVSPETGDRAIVKTTFENIRLELRR